MKASVIRQFGGPEVFAYTDVDTPAPGAGEVRVKVHACGINHYDIFLRRGEVVRELAWPHVMGADVVGEVDAVGAGVSHFQPGQRVIVAPGYPLDPRHHDHHPVNLARSYCVTGGIEWGGYAEYMVAPARFVIADPPDLPFDQLASLPLVLMTAVHAVRTLAQVGAEQQVLVQAGASGSGAMCVQVARALGARVAATVGNREKADFVRGLGAELVIEGYDNEQLVGQIKEWTGGQGVDAVIDNVGGSVFDGNVRALKRGGHFVNFGMVGGHRADYVFPLIFYKQLHLHGSMMGTMEELEWGLQQVRQGTIQSILDRTFPLQDAAAAHQYVESRQVKGKVVLVMGG